MPTESDVLEAFEGARVQAVSVHTLKAALRDCGYHPADVAVAIEAAIANGALVMTELGHLKKP